jgi:hypothetical protein
MNNDQILRLAKAKEYAQNKGGDCLSTEYLGANSKLTWKCSHGHEWDAPTKNVMFGSWCPQCAGYFTKEEGIKRAQQYALAKGGKCLSIEYVNSISKLKWECSHGHTWEAKYNILIGQHWCPECNELKNATRSLNKNGLKLAQEYAKNKGGDCLSTEYIGAKKELIWKCANNHIWNTKYKSVVLDNSWCPQCSAYYYKEHKIRDILEYLLEVKFEKSRPKWNINPKTNKRLELDGYCEELKIAFEFQGEHHYKVGSFGKTKEELEYIQFKDSIKKKNCIDNQVKLIIIDDNFKLDDSQQIINYILQLLKYNNIEINKKIDISIIESLLNKHTNHQNNYLEKAKQLAINKGGWCLSTNYINSETKMEWKCQNHLHPTWSSAFQNIQKGSWCPECGKEKSNLAKIKNKS